MTLRGNGCYQCRGPTVSPRQRVHLIFHGWCAKSVASLAERAWNLRRQRVNFPRRAWRVLVVRLQPWARWRHSISKIKQSQSVETLSTPQAPLPRPTQIPTPHPAPCQRCNVFLRLCPAYLCSPRDHFLQPWSMKSSRSPFPYKFSRKMLSVSPLCSKGCFCSGNQAVSIAKIFIFH